MKAISRAILICLLPLSSLTAQTEEAPTKDIPAFQQEFLNLPKEERDEFRELVGEAQRLFNQKRIFETIEVTQKAEKIFERSPDLLNVQGACQVEFRNFDRAMEYFKKADKLAPGQPTILFNIAELNFVTKDWAAAETSLNALLDAAGEDVSGPQLQMSRLIEFKLLLSKLKLGKTEEAKKLAEKYDYLDDSPFPYYAESAIAFSNGEDVTAEAAMARAARIFRDPSVLSPWQDTMIEFGYIKGFFGGEEGVVTPAAE